MPAAMPCQQQQQHTSIVTGRRHTVSYIFLALLVAVMATISVVLYRGVSSLSYFHFRARTNTQV